MLELGVSLGRFLNQLKVELKMGLLRSSLGIVGMHKTKKPTVISPVAESVMEPSTYVLSGVSNKRTV
jgi:hypothetical protein